MTRMHFAHDRSSQPSLNVLFAFRDPDGYAITVHTEKPKQATATLDASSGYPPRNIPTLFLPRFSDWRLATIDEFRGIYDQHAESPGESPRSHDHEPEPVFFHIKGNLFLTGMRWVSTSPVDGENPSESETFFDLQNGKVIKDEHHSIRERRALCLRRSSE
jgi:hypothetical protein